MKQPKLQDMLTEYNFADGIRGKYAHRYTEGSNVVVLAPDVALHFPTARQVNRSLRSLFRRKVVSRSKSRLKA